VGVDEVGHLLAMEYLDGVSLHAAIAKLGRNGGPFTFPMQAKVLLEVLEGLRYAHDLKDYDGRSLQIVHRDVTPHNIIITFDGQVKLLDFGIAKAATSSVRTATGVIKGKLTYMAPEQARGENVDARADLYAVGVMLWEAVTGKRRWPTGLSQPALFTRLAAGEPPQSPNAASFGYPAEIDAMVLRSLATKPDERFQTAGEFGEALEDVLDKLEPVSLRDLGGMLANAFADGRKRLRDVIEEQFRAIEAGGHPSEPHQLPAVSPPGSNTASEAFERPSPAGGQTVAGQTAKLDTHSIHLAALESGPPAPSRLRSRVAMGLAAAALSVAALAIGVAGSRISGASGGSGSAPLPQRGQHVEEIGSQPPPGPPGPLSTGQAQDAKPYTETQAGPGDTATPGEYVHRADGHSRAGSPALPTTTRGPAARPSASVQTLPIGPPSPSASPAPPNPTNDTLPVRRPDGRPKVQLERDNPWP
jgi:eukaryotic-like serine/threonine-protein kinase